MKMITKRVTMSTRACVPFMVTLDCICGGIYRSTGIKEDDKFQHICDKCGTEIYAFNEYPNIEYETVGKNPVNTDSRLVHVKEEE